MFDILKRIEEAYIGKDFALLKRAYEFAKKYNLARFCQY